MHLLHRSSMFGGGGRAPRRVGSSPRAPPSRHQLFSKSESIKKRSATAKKSDAKGSKRARLRAGLAAALQELRLAAGRHKRGSPVSAGATQTQLGSQAQLVAFRAADAAAGPPCATAAPSPEGTASGGGALLLLLALLALVCVVALGRAPAVCCCTCAAWWCRGPSAAERRRAGAAPSAVA